MSRGYWKRGVWTNNQAPLKDKSSTAQSVPAGLSAFSSQLDRASRSTRMESAMQPYEIRQLSDGSIDYNHYYARPVRLLTPNMQAFALQATSPKAIVVCLAVIASVIAAPWIG
jgi:hypothetical protein